MDIGGASLLPDSRAEAKVVVVMENVTREPAGNEQVEARYELLPRGSYIANVSRSELKPIVVDRSRPLYSCIRLWFSNSALPTGYCNLKQKT